MAALSETMKYTSSIVFGASGLALYILAFPLLYNYLYIDFSLQPMVFACKETFYPFVCNLYVYVLLFIMETPMFVACFIAIAVVIYLLNKINPKVKVNILLVCASYFMCYLLYALLFTPGKAVSLLLLFSFVYQSVLFGVILLAGNHLTSVGT